MKRLLAIEAAALCIIRKWWRPVTCIWISLAMAMHGFVIPLVRLIQGKDIDTDLASLAALVSAVAAAFAVREWGKVKAMENEE